MKVLIKLLSVFSLSAISTFSIVSCSSNKKDEDTKVIHLNKVKSIFKTGLIVNSKQFKEKTCDKTNFEKIAIGMINKQYTPTSDEKKPNIEITDTDVKFEYFSTEKGDNPISSWEPIEVHEIVKFGDIRGSSNVFCKISSNSNKTDGETDIFMININRYDSED